MIFESDFFVVLTASHLKLKSELLILFTTFKLFCQEMKKNTVWLTWIVAIAQFVTSAQNNISICMLKFVNINRIDNT